MKPMRIRKVSEGIHFTNYNDWIAYVHQQINIKKSRIGQRSMQEIQEEIEKLKKLDKEISDKVRATYSLKK